MKLQRYVVVLDAADIDAVSTFWARMLGGRVYADETFHCVLDRDGRWLLGVQLAPDHEAPDWPDGNAQQIHLDLHVEDPREAHSEAMNCGARLLQQVDDLDAEEGFQVYADPLQNVRPARPGCFSRRGVLLRRRCRRRSCPRHRCP